MKSDMKLDTSYGPIYFDITGPDDAPAVVFTHGITLDHTAFDSQASALFDRYRVLRWDLPGHGRSVPFHGEFRFDTLADGLKRTMDAAGLNSAVLVGQSIGSWIGQYFAHKHPERAHALVDIGGTPLHHRTSPFMALVWRILLKSSVLIPEGQFYRWFARERAFTADAREHLETAASRMGKRRIMEFTNSYAKDWLAGLPEAPSVPLLITHGEHEIGFVRKQSARWHAGAPGSQYAVIPKAGHLANQDNPAAFNSVLMEFLLRLENETTGSKPRGPSPASETRREAQPV